MCKYERGAYFWPAYVKGVLELPKCPVGIILILTMTGTFGIRVAKTKSKDMIWPDMGLPWIIAYGLWNLSYCYNCISNRSFYAGLLLIAGCSLAEFALIANLGVMVYEVKTIKDRRRNPLGEGIFVDSAFYKANLEANNLGKKQAGQDI